MAINLGGVVYLTMAEATEVLGIHKTLGHAYLKRGEFPNAINMDCQVVLKDALANYPGLVVSEKNMSNLFAASKCAHYLVPLTDVVNKGNRRIDSKLSKTDSLAKKRLERMELRMNRLRDESRIAEEKMERLKQSIAESELAISAKKASVNGEVATVTM